MVVTLADELSKMSKDDMSLEDLFTVTYCVVDDFFKLLFSSQKQLRRSNNNDPAFTDAEVITIALVGELRGEDSEKGWYGFVKKNYKYLFPKLCSRTRYGRRKRRLKDVMSLIREQILYQLDIGCDKHGITDSFPLRLCRLSRLSCSGTPFEYTATVGYCPSLKEYFYGFKVHLLTDLRGVPIAIVLTSAHPHDTVGFEALMEEVSFWGLSVIIIVGDKAYVGEDFKSRVKELYGVDILAIGRRYDKDLPESGLNEMLRKTRRIIETSVSLFTEHFNGNWTRCRSLMGLATSLVVKLTAFNLANYLNQLMGKPLLEIASFTA